MPAKKTSAKKPSARRAAPAKKKVVAKKPAPRKAAPVRKSAPKATKTMAAKKNNNISLDNLREDDELTAQYPAFKKNNFLSLIVLAVGILLVAVGIYIQMHKNSPADTNIPGDTVTEQTGKVTSGTAATVTTGVAPSGTYAVDAQRIVETFYNDFNQDLFTQMPALYDANFTNVPNLRLYFSPTRLQRRKANIIGDLQISDVNAVIDHPLVQKNPNAMVVQYNVTYTLKQDGKLYDESRYAYTLKYGNTTKLNGFECQTNCAASPFFHLR